MKRVSTRAVIFKNNELVVFKRRKNGEEYYSLPGGGLENYEDMESCVLREIEEEYSCKSKILGYLGRREDNNSVQYYFHLELFGNPILGGEEKDRNCKENQYTIVYIPLESIKNSKIYNVDLIENAIINKYVEKDY